MSDKGKRNFSLGGNYIDLLVMMAQEEDRPMARIVREALRDYARYHHTQLLSVILQEESRYVGS